MDSRARHQRLTDIYLEACDLQGEDRVAYLDQACGDDLSLREEVEAMLAKGAIRQVAPSQYEVVSPFFARPKATLGKWRPL